MIEREKYYMGILIAITTAYGILVNAFHVIVNPQANRDLWIVGTVVIPILLLVVGQRFLFWHYYPMD